jgi:hypothetical protein
MKRTADIALMVAVAAGPWLAIWAVVHWLVAA